MIISPQQQISIRYSDYKQGGITYYEQEKDLEWIVSFVFFYAMFFHNWNKLRNELSRGG
jgi:hypothetical protein